MRSNGCRAAARYDTVGSSQLPRTRTRRLASSHRDGGIELERFCTFRMRGIGCTNPHWSHGSSHGDPEVGGETIGVDDFASLSSMHIQTLCRARYGDRVGIGVLEQMALGSHAPTKLEGILDAATATSASWATILLEVSLWPA